MAIDFRDGEILTATQLNDLQAEYAPALQRIAGEAHQTSYSEDIPSGAHQVMLNEVTGDGLTPASGGVRIAEPGVYLVMGYFDARLGVNDGGTSRECFLEIDEVAGQIGLTASSFYASSDRRVLNQLQTIVPIAGGEVVRFMTTSTVAATVLQARISIVRVTL